MIRGPLNSVVHIIFDDEFDSRDFDLKKSLRDKGREFLLCGGTHREFKQIASEAVILAAQDLCDGNKKKMSDLLGMSRLQVYNILKKGKEK